MINVGALMASTIAYNMAQENLKRAAAMAASHHDPDSYVDHDTYDEEPEDDDDEDWHDDADWEEQTDWDEDEDDDPGDLDNFAEEMYENEYFAGDGEVPMPIDCADAFDWWYE